MKSYVLTNKNMKIYRSFDSLKVNKKKINDQEKKREKKK